MPSVTRAYIGLGANLGDRAETIRSALAELSTTPGVELVAVSALLDTEPVGPVDQPRFLNGVAVVDTSLAARELLDLLLAVEARNGRDRAAVPAQGPRTLDLDLLLYGDAEIREEDLQIPHPRLHERAFVLDPLLEVAPGLEVPGRGTVEALEPGYTEVVSHLDDLDEYEAELELLLKKEYQAVFGLFRYCVLTPDATYLCNRLERTVTPQPAYPFINLRLEDVWVWDKNRPTRMIPRTEIFVTSGDVTIEELRGEGDDEPLTAETLAERIGESTPTRRRLLKQSGPRVFEAGCEILSRHALGGRRREHADRLRPLRRRRARRAVPHRDGVAAHGRRARLAPLRLPRLRVARRHRLSSTVPRLIREYEHVAERWAKAPLLVSGPA